MANASGRPAGDTAGGAGFANAVCASETNITPAGRRKNDLGDLRAALITRAADLAITLLGEPNHRLKSKTEMRWGRKGSLCLTVTGAKAGLWADHESGDGGDLFNLIQRERGGDFGDAIKYARDFCGMRINAKCASANDAHRHHSDNERTKERNSKSALQIFNAATSLDHPIAQRYFERRKLILPDDLSYVLRFNYRCPFEHEDKKNYPCMVALYRDIRTDEPRAITRTALTPEGVKIDRKTLGPWVGCACKLTADEDVSLGLHIAEGIETGIAAMMLGFVPMWVTGSANATALFPVLSGIEILTIITDHDKINPKTGKPPGQTAARNCSQRWTAAGVHVRRVTPNTLGDDMADIVAREPTHG